MSNWSAPQHSYEEIRETMIEVFRTSSPNDVNQFSLVVEQTARALTRRYRPPALPGGVMYPGAQSQLHPNDRMLILEIVWDLFRQGIITLGINDNNPGWPWMRLSRFGKEVLNTSSPYRFHDTTSFLKLVKAEVPDISQEALLYLDEAVAAFYADCLLSSCVMLGVAAEAEFLRLIDVACANSTHGVRFAPVQKLKFIREKITKFHDLLKPIVASLPKAATEDLDTNLSAIQSVLRIARNDAGNPTGAKPPTRDQAFISLQLFVPFARQVMRLRDALK
ncbi:MAG TPA: hypothetical protein VMH84_16875 [Xanthobacteraceae bacterium]|nr:hypothetical protein [Xanthobacteraceae bacterium]